MDDENPSIPPLLSGNEVLSPVIDMGESKDRREIHREIYRESFYKIFPDEKMSLFLSCHRWHIALRGASIIRSCIQFFDRAVDLGWILVELWRRRELWRVNEDLIGASVLFCFARNCKRVGIVADILKNKNQKMEIFYECYI